MKELALVIVAIGYYAISHEYGGPFTQLVGSAMCGAAFGLIAVKVVKS